MIEKIKHQKEKLANENQELNHELTKLVVKKKKLKDLLIQQKEKTLTIKSKKEKLQQHSTELPNKVFKIENLLLT